MFQCSEKHCFDSQVLLLFLTLVNASLQSVSCPPWSLKGRGCQPIRWDSSPLWPGVGSTPRAGAALLPLGVKMLPQLTAPAGRVPWRKDSMECPEVGSSSLPWPEVSEVFFEWLILGMNLTGSSTQAKALPQDSRHMEDTSRACTHSRRWVGEQCASLCFPFKIQTHTLLKSFRKYNQNDM